jgi:hypothetical protein
MKARADPARVLGDGRPRSEIGSSATESVHVSEALQYRGLDRPLG